MKTLENIFNIGACSGKSDGLITYLREEIEGLFDCSQKDKLGSVSFTKKLGDGKKLLISCPLDTAGLIATFVEGTRVYVSALGSFHPFSTAFSKVQFDKAEGILLPCGNLTQDTPLSDFYVELGDKEKAKKIVLGDIATFKCETKILPDGKIYSFGAGTKMCIYMLVQLAKTLLSEDCSFFEDNGIGEVCFAFISQDKLGSRGACVVANSFSPDIAINLACVDKSEKNVGKIEDGKAYIKMLGKGFSHSDTAVALAENILCETGISYEKYLSVKDLSPLYDICKGAIISDACEICIPISFWGTTGECVKKII